MNSSIEISGVEELALAAQWLEEQIKSSGMSVIALYGAMGAGKTTLVGEICRRSGASEGISSPTFSIVNRYKSSDGKEIFHFDCYRFEDEREALDIGIFEYFDSGNLCFVEWPEKIEGVLSQCDVLSISIEALSPTARRFSLR